jgi:hypothetical protein
LYLGLPVQIGTPIPGSRLELALGSAANPSLTFLGDTNTGIFSPAADTIAFAEGGTEVGRFDSSGNFGVGTSSPSTYGVLVASQSNASSDTYAAIRNSAGGVGGAVQGTRLLFLGDSGYSQSVPTAYIRSVSNDGGSNGHGTLTFGTHAGNGTCPERARIDASGNLLVGTTTNTYSARLVVDGAADNVAANFYRAGTNSGSAIVTFVSNAGGTRTLKSYIDVANGTLVTISDETQKENLVEIENAADKVCTLRAAVGNYIGGEAKHPFLIAQDVQKVLPEAVAVTPNGKLGMSYTDTIPLLVAAIKELKAELDATKAEVALLKGAA